MKELSHQLLSWHTFRGYVNAFTQKVLLRWVTALKVIWPLGRGTLFGSFGMINVRFIGLLH